MELWIWEMEISLNKPRNGRNPLENLIGSITTLLDCYHYLFETRDENLNSK